MDGGRETPSYRTTPVLRSGGERPPILPARSQMSISALLAASFAVVAAAHMQNPLVVGGAIITPNGHHWQLVDFSSPAESCQMLVRQHDDARNGVEGPRFSSTGPEV